MAESPDRAETCNPEISAESNEDDVNVINAEEPTKSFKDLVKRIINIYTHRK